MNVTNSSSTYIQLLLSLLFIVTSSSLKANSQTDVGCSLVNCGQGTCKASNTSIGMGFECECYPGWKKIQIGPLIFPSCILPNCTINLGCNGAAPTQSPWAQPAPPVSPLTPPPLNFSNACSLTWCGDGVCLAYGTGHTCQCNAGALNLKNRTDLPCLNPCSLGADCGNIGMGLEFPQPPRAPPPSSPTSSLLQKSVSPSPESTEETRSRSAAGGQRAWTVLPLAAMFFAWF